MTTATESRTAWTVDASHSTAEFSVRHLMISTVKGQFGKIEGTVTLDEANPANSEATLTIDATSVDTRSADRDGHLRSADFFDVEQFPNITFKTTKVEPTSSTQARVTGDLTIRGVTKSVIAEVSLEGEGKDPWGNQRRAFRGETKIDRKEWGLLWNNPLENGGVLVSDEVKILVELQTIKQQ